MRSFFIFIFFLSQLLGSSDFYRGEVLAEHLRQESLAPLEGKCRIILIRHAETDWNAKGKKQGWTDIPLNEKGKEQAMEMSAKLAGLAVQSIYTSSLSRAKETAEALAVPHPGAQIVSDPTLRFYRKDSRPWYFFLQTKEQKKEHMVKEIVEDCTAYLKDLSSRHSGETVLVVTHARVIKYLFLHLSDPDQKLIKIKNGAIVRLLGDGQSLSIEQ